MIPTIPAKKIISKNTSPDAWFGLDYGMNIYRGCSHGCIFCDSRSDCFQNKDFGIVKAKENALAIIRDDLRRKVQKGVIGTGAMSDPYNPAEADLKLTRHALELINAMHFGAAPCTRSDLVTRDADVLLDIKSHSPVMVKFSISTADDELCLKLEPGAPPPSRRFEAISRLSRQGVFCGVVMSPILPFVNDNEDNIIKICRMAKEAGAKFVYTYMGMTLRPGSREYYYHYLNKILPGSSEKYVKRFGTRYNCQSPYSKKLWALFASECECLGLIYDMKAIITHYKAGYHDSQLRLF